MAFNAKPVLECIMNSRPAWTMGNILLKQTKMNSLIHFKRRKGEKRDVSKGISESTSPQGGQLFQGTSPLEVIILGVPSDHNTINS